MAGTDAIVSIVVPTFNRARFLGPMLASVFAQRDCPDFEVILVDDASSDDTATVVGAMSHPLTYVRLERNGGVARARQAGVEHARGRLLAFHDSDDLMLPGRLGSLARVLDAHPEVGAVFSNGVIEAADGRETGRVIPESLAERLDGRAVSIRDILRDGLPMYLQTALIRRAAFDRAGGIDTTLARHADLDLSCRIALTSGIVYVDHPSFLYRLHDANQTRDRVRLREGLAEVMSRLRERHPECVALCGEAWYLERERTHLRRVAIKHFQHWRFVRAVSAAARALRLTLRPPSTATGIR